MKPCGCRGEGVGTVSRPTRGGLEQFQGCRSAAWNVFSLSLEAGLSPVWLLRSLTRR